MACHRFSCIFEEVALKFLVCIRHCRMYKTECIPAGKVLHFPASTPPSGCFTIERGLLGRWALFEKKPALWRVLHFMLFNSNVKFQWALPGFAPGLSQTYLYRKVSKALYWKALRTFHSYKPDIVGIWVANAWVSTVGGFRCLLLPGAGGYLPA